MTETLKVLGQVSPPATTLTTLYTSPAGLGSAVSSLVICNTNSAPITVSVSVAIAGAVDAPAQYLYSQLPIAPHDTFAATFGLTLSPTDVVRCWASATGANFQMFGAEES